VFSGVGEGFDELTRRRQVPITARRRWLQAWIDTYPDWDPWLILVHDGKDLVAAAPLAQRQRGLILEVVMLGDGPTDDVRLPADTPEFSQHLAQELSQVLATRTPWRLRLRQLPTGDPVISALCQLLRVHRVVAGQGMPIVEVTGNDPQKYLSRNTRKALAKVRNRLRDLSLEPEVCWTNDHDEIIALLPELMRVHRERDLALQRRPDHDDPAAAAFYREVIAQHARVGEIDLLTLRLAGDLAAYVCGFRDGRTLRSWDNRLAPRWADVSAGRLANTEALVHVIRGKDYDALDWMRGEESYKLQSATRVVPTTSLYAWSSRGFRQVDELAQKAALQARSALRRWPQLEQTARRAHGMWLRLRRW
jgi:CelD/BcsL family acetyltransferase involved in cellulose biosynthesis